MISLHGVIPAIPTPFHTDESLDLDSLQRNLERWNRAPLAGYVVGGSNGEFVSLGVEERVAVVQAAREVIPPERPLIAGSGLESTRETIALTKKMGEAGADAVIVVTPSYYTSRMDAEALESHYRQVADASPLPLLLYSVPANTGIDLPLPAAVKLAQHPQVIGMKDSGGNLARIASLVSDTPDEFQVLAGSASFLLAALSVGAVGCVAALGNLAAEPLVQLIEGYRSGDLSLSRSIQHRMIQPNHAVTAGYGVAGLKAALDLCGYYGGPVRSPLLPLNDQQAALLKAILQEAELI